jgi:DNA modification methylase
MDDAQRLSGVLLGRGSEQLARALPNPRAALAEVAAVEGCVQRGRRWFPHPFPARMPPEVASRAIENFSLPGQVVLDPMSGSGVVAFAASNAGRVAIGRDIDPLAVLLGRSLCATVDTTVLRAYAEDIYREAFARTRRLSTSNKYTRNLSAEDKKFLDYWFPAKSVIAMFALAEVVLENPKNSLSVVGAAILSSLVIARESGVSLARDLSRSRPHKVAEKKPKEPFVLWKEKSEAFARFYESRKTLQTTPQADIDWGDARALDLGSDSVDVVVTSPPYLNAIDYIRTSKFSLIFLGCELAALRDIRATSIGTEVGLQHGHLSVAFERIIKSKVRERARRPMLRRYLFDLGLMLAEIGRVLKPGGTALYVLGPSIVSRRTYDSVAIFSMLAEENGFEVLGDARRALSIANRSLPPPNRTKRRQAINQRMTCEFYVALRKPHA